MTTAISMRDAKRLYAYGNDRGSGYAPYRDVPGPDTIEAAVTAAEADGWTLILERHTSDDVAVLSDADGALLGIGGDAHGNGAWAVVLSDQIKPLAALDASLDEAV